jgi:aspartyl protease family protein
MNEPPDTGNTGTQQKYGKAMTYAAWLLALGLLTAGFNHWLGKERNPNQHLRSAQSADGTQVVLERNRFGHYLASGSINGQAVEFMLDTGATMVAIPGRVADHLGLKRGAQMQVQTANGNAPVYATRLDVLRLGEIELRDVKAHISPSMDGDEVLLGMSVLKYLDFSQQGDTLTLKQRTTNQ